jgi:hypothetical protein
MLLCLQTNIGRLERRVRELETQNAQSARPAGKEELMQCEGHSFDDVSKISEERRP